MIRQLGFTGDIIKLIIIYLCVVSGTFILNSQLVWDSNMLKFELINCH